MESDVDISFIIPAYNVKKEFLDRCVKSIIEIKKIKYEILLVDDGSSKAFHEEDKKIAQKYNWDIINCAKDGMLRSIEDIHEDVFNAVKMYL